MTEALPQWLTEYRRPCNCFGYVYVIHREDGLFKIGMSSRVEDRIRRIGGHVAQPLTIILIVPTPDAKRLERRLHVIFVAQRVRGEWFRFDKAQLDQLTNICIRERMPKHRDACDAPTTQPLRFPWVTPAMSREGPYEWVSVLEASRRLKISVSTVRRMIESGQLIGEREPLARGSPKDRFRVKILADAPTPLHPDAPTPEPPPSDDAASDAPALTTKLVDTVLAQAAEIGELRERVGRAEAESEARSLALEWTENRRAEAEARAVDTQARLDQAQAELERVRRRSVWKPWTW